MIINIDDFFTGMYLGILVCAVIEYILFRIDLRKTKIDEVSKGINVK